MNSPQADVKKVISEPSQTSKSNTQETGKSGGHRQAASYSSVDSVTDIETLERDLAQLDTELSQVEAQNASASSQNSVRTLREQFEGLLRYKQQQTLEHTENSRISVPINSRAVKEDLDNIEEQITILESYLSNRQSELQSLRNEIKSIH